MVIFIEKLILVSILFAIGPYTWGSLSFLPPSSSFLHHTISTPNPNQCQRPTPSQFKQCHASLQTPNLHAQPPWPSHHHAVAIPSLHLRLWVWTNLRGSSLRVRPQPPRLHTHTTSLLRGGVVAHRSGCCLGRTMILLIWCWWSRHVTRWWLRSKDVKHKGRRRGKGKHDFVIHYRTKSCFHLFLYPFRKQQKYNSIVQYTMESYFRC